MTEPIKSPETTVAGIELGPYLVEMYKNGPVNYSHYILHDLYCKHGQRAVDAALDEYFAAKYADCME